MYHFPTPRVLECTRLVLKSSKKNQRIVRDYKFDLYMGGERDVYVDGFHYHISKGSLVFRKPGQNVIGYGDYDMYMLTLDLSESSEQAVENYCRSSDSKEQKKCPLELLDMIPTVFTPHSQYELIELYEKLSGCSHPGISDRALQSRYATDLLFLVLADSMRHQRGELDLYESSNSYVRRACDYINEHYSEPLPVEKIAEMLSLNTNYLIRLFGRELGRSPHRYILETRLMRSRYILTNSSCSVEEVARTCGFNTPSYFIKCFKKRFGKTPLAFRNESR